MERIFEVVSQSKYHITINQIKDIEDCPDEFVTEEELNEMGIDFCTSGTRFLEGKITSAIQQYLSQIPRGKKSIIIDDDDLIDVLKDIERPISSFVKGTRRVGNRLLKHEQKQQTRVTFDDWKRLVLAFEYALMNKYKIDVDIKLTTSKRQETIIQLKKIVDWSDIVDQYKHGNMFPPENERLVWMKKLYDDPMLINEPN